MGDEAHVRGDHELGRHRLDVVERSEEADVGRIEADLLLRLAQRRRHEIDVAGMAAAAGKRDLPLVVAQPACAPREEQVRLPVDREQWDQHGGGRLPRPHEHGALARGEDRRERVSEMCRHAWIRRE